MLFYLSLLILLIVFTRSFHEEHMTMNEYSTLFQNIHRQLKPTQKITEIIKISGSEMTVFVYDTSIFVLEQYNVTFQNSVVKVIRLIEQEPMNNSTFGIENMKEIPTYIDASKFM
jgi:hypothetical protein